MDSDDEESHHNPELSIDKVNEGSTVKFNYYVEKFMVKKNRSIVIDLENRILYYSHKDHLPTTAVLNTSKAASPPGAVTISLRVGPKLKEKKWVFKDAEEANKFQTYIAAVNGNTDQLIEIFNDIDKARKRQISWKDLRMAALKFGLRLSPAEARALIVLADNNQNGYIDFKEFFDFFMNDNLTNLEMCVLEWRNKLATDFKNIESRMELSENEFESLSVEDTPPVLANGEITLNILQKSRYTFRLQLLKDVAKAFVGNIYLTNYRLIFCSYLRSRSTFFSRQEIPPCFDEISLPMAFINKVEVLKNDVSYAIALYCKDMRVMKIKLEANESFIQIFKGVVESQAFPAKPTQLFAFYLKENYVIPPENMSGEGVTSSSQVPIDGWKLFTMQREFSRQGALQTNNWRVWNDNYSLIDTYPREFLLPGSLSESDIVEAAKHRSKCRIPALTWRSKENGACLVRSSQPMVGVLGHKCLADKLLLNFYRVRGDPNDRAEIESPSDFYIVDCRKPIAATANSALGKGVEDPKNYERTKLEFCDIENIHTMRASLKLLDEAIINPDSTKFLSLLEASNWLLHIVKIIEGSVHVAEKLNLERASVLVHCSDGWDRTSQICATSQLLLDPYYRTIEGFCVLIEKDWCAFGHKFKDRVGHSDSNIESQERSPVFLQWLDVVHQLMHQFKNQFEFTEKLLIFIADAMNSCMFGTFLGNSEKERKADLDCENKTKSAWSYVMTHKDDFVNDEYVLYNGAIWPSAAIKKMVLWERYFCRWDSDLHPRVASGVDWTIDWGIRITSPRTSSMTSNTGAKGFHVDETGISRPMSVSCRTGTVNSDDPSSRRASIQRSNTVNVPSVQPRSHETRNSGSVQDEMNDGANYDKQLARYLSL